MIAASTIALQVSSTVWELVLTDPHPMVLCVFSDLLGSFHTFAFPCASRSPTRRQFGAWIVIYFGLWQTSGTIQGRCCARTLILWAIPRDAARDRRRRRRSIVRATRL